MRGAREQVLVTGGAGFIGTNLVRRLLGLGVKVRVLDDFSTGSWDNLAELSTEVDVYEGDVRDMRALKRAAANVRTIYHLASLPGGFTDDDGTLVFDVNVKGTLSALMVAREQHAGFVFASSSAVYGNRSAYLLHEDVCCAPSTALGAHKLAGETYCRLFHEAYGVKTVILRLFDVFGPYERGGLPHSRVVARFAHALVDGAAPILFGDGTQTRDLVYVDNVCEAFLAAAHTPEAAGGCFNIGSGEGIPIQLLYKQMAELVGSHKPVHRAPARPGDPQHRRAALGHATRVLKYAPVVRLREGLARTIAWHKGERERQMDRAWFTPPHGIAIDEIDAVDAVEEIAEEAELPIYLEESDRVDA